MGLIATMYDSYLTAYRGQTGKDARSGQTINYSPAAGATTLVTNVPCSLQQASFSLVVRYAQANIEVSAVVHTAQDIGAEAHDILVVTDRTGVMQYYRVEGAQQPVGRGRTWEYHCMFLRQPGTTIATNTQGIAS